MKYKFIDGYRLKGVRFEAFINGEERVRPSTYSEGHPHPQPPVWQWPPEAGPEIGEEGLSPLVFEAKVEKSRRLFFSPQWGQRVSSALAESGCNRVNCSLHPRQAYS